MKNDRYRSKKIVRKTFEKAFIVLLRFSTIHVCELGFSTFTNIVAEKREKFLGPEEQISVALSAVRSSISQITKNPTKPNITTHF